MAPITTKKPAVVSKVDTFPPVRGSAFGFVAAPSTATVLPGLTTAGSTVGLGTSVVVVAPTAVVVVAPMVVVVVVSVQAQVSLGSVLVVVGVLAELVQGLGTVALIGVVVTSLPSRAALVLTSKS